MKLDSSLIKNRPCHIIWSQRSLLQRKDKFAQVQKLDIGTVLKSIALSYFGTLLTNIENPSIPPSSSQTIFPGTKKLVPLSDQVVACYANTRHALLRSKPPFVLLSIAEKADTALPFI